MDTFRTGCTARRFRHPLKLPTFQATRQQWEGDIPFFRDMCADATGDVLELMSGTGRVSLPLLRAAVPLTCVDYSAEMLRVLSQRLKAENLIADLHEQDVRALDVGRFFDLVLLPFHSFSEIVDPNDRALALRAIRRHLARQGRLIITLHNPVVQIPSLDGMRRKLCERPIPDRNAVLRFWFTARYHAGAAVAEAHQEYEILGLDGCLLEKRELDLHFAIIGREEFEKQAGACGLRILRMWGDYSRNPFQPATSPFMIWELGSEPSS